MNIKKISAAVLMLSLAGAVLAETPYPDGSKSVSTKTRAEVIADYQQARNNGELVWDYDYPGVIVTTDSHKTRAEVVEELKQYQRERANRN